MHLDITPEVLVAQLDLGHGESTLKQTQTAMKIQKTLRSFQNILLA